MSRLIASLTLGPLTTLSMLSAQAMVCVDQRFNQAFQINEQTGHSFQIGFPQNQGMSFRGIRPAKPSTQPRKTRTWCALKFKWTPVLAF